MADWTQAGKLTRAQAAAQGGRVEGTVFDAISAAPVPCAQISILGVDALTSPEGQFAFVSVPPGPVSVSIDADGYISTIAGGTVTEGGTLSLQVLLTSVAGGALEGHVKDQATGQPIGGATVVLDMGRVAVADAAGAYAFSRVDTGAHTVEARGRGYVPATVATSVVSGSARVVDFALEPGAGPIGTTAAAVQGHVPLLGLAALGAIAWGAIREWTR